MTESKFVKYFTAKAKEAYNIEQVNGALNAPQSFAESIALMHAALSEALSADRVAGFYTVPADRTTGREAVELALANVIIKIMIVAHETNLRIAEAVEINLALNRICKHDK